MLDPAAPASRLVVRGGVLDRAAYEAVSAQLADWQLDYPLDPGGLAARLEAGIPAPQRAAALASCASTLMLKTAGRAWPPSRPPQR